MSASIHASPTTYASRAAANVPPRPRLSPTSGVPRNKDAIARPFQLPSDNQGFKYLYMPCRLRRHYSETRKALSKLGLPSSRVLDVCYPVNGMMVGILVHNDYVEEATMTLSENGISLFGDCDPNDPILLKDPKFDSDPEEVRKQTAIMIHQNRLLKVIQRLRSPIRLAVARSFIAQDWITQADHDTFFASSSRDTGAQMNDIAANFIQATSPYSDQQ
ncbi:hypothetical protein BDB01DRAFT_808356 [Pilobolus umbonatus]|nr:hypothetical protein BDB01DRAFT_808356 [Pilobolus umbonatus]